MTSKPPVRRRQPGDPASPADAAAQAPAAPAARPQHKRLAPSAPREDEAPPLRAGGQQQLVTSARLSELEAIAGMADVDMAALLLGGPSRSALPDIGQKVRGTVHHASPDDVYVDLGLRTQGYLARRELPNAKAGDEIVAYVIAADDNGVQLSTRLSGEAASQFLEEAYESGIPVDGLVMSRNQGGYEVRIGSQRAFCPVSHIARLPLADPDSVLQQTLPFLVLEMGDKTVVSRRALEERELEGARAAFWKEAKEGDTRIATVTNVQPWGLFLDLDGVEARMARKDASWDDASLDAIYARGQRVEVRIVDLDPVAARVSVSARDPGLDPWLRVHDLVVVGKVYTGPVVSEVDFGAFVQIAPGLQGLLHLSRLDGTIPPRGQSIEVRVLQIDADRRRIELAPPSFDPAAQAANGTGVEVTGEVTEIKPNGVRVRLEDGRVGWLPSRSVELQPGTVLSQRFRVGHPLTARISAVDAGGRVTLSQRTDEDDERDQWREQLQQTQSSSMGTLGDLFRRAKR